MRTQRIVLGLAIAIGGTGAVKLPRRRRNIAEPGNSRWPARPTSGGSAAIEIPDVSRIVACLRQNTPQLSSGCRAVFESSAEQQQANRVPPQRGPQQNAPRGRAPQQMQPQAVQPQPRPYYEEDE